MADYLDEIAQDPQAYAQKQAEQQALNEWLAERGGATNVGMHAILGSGLMTPADQAVQMEARRKGLGLAPGQSMPGLGLSLIGGMLGQSDLARQGPLGQVPGVVQKARQEHAAAAPQSGAVDPSTLSFVDSAQQADHAVVEDRWRATGGPARGAMGLSLNLPAGPSLKGLRGAAKSVGDLQGQFKSVAEETAGKIDSAREKAGSAINELAFYEQEQSEKIEGIIRKGMDTAESIVAERAERRADAQRRVDDKLIKWQEARQEYEAAEVDPSRRFSGGSKVGAAIAMALGAMGAALSRGPNTAMQIIQSEIERDVAAQRANIDKKRGAVGMLGNELAMARDILGDEDAAIAAAKASLWRDVARNIEMEREKYKGVMVGPKADQALAIADQQAAIELGKVKEAGLAGELKRSQAQVGAEQSVVSAGQRQQRQALRAKAAQAVSTPPPGLALVDPNYRPTKDDSKKAKDLASAHNRASKLMDRLIKWRAKYQSETLPGPAKREGADIAAELITELKELKKMGANFTEMEKALLRIPEDPGEYGFVMNSLLGMKERLNERTAASIEPYGYTLKSIQARGKGRKLGG